MHCPHASSSWYGVSSCWNLDFWLSHESGSYLDSPRLLLFSHSVVSDSLWPHGLQHAGHPCPSLSPELAQIDVHWVSDAIQPTHPLLSPSPPAFSLSQHRAFSNKLALGIRWMDKYWRFSFIMSPSNEYSGLISFSIDWFDCPAVQGTLKSLFQNHSSKASVLQCSALWSSSHIHTWLLEKPQLWLQGPLSVIWALG